MFYEDKALGIESGDFRLRIGQTYAESILERHQLIKNEHVDQEDKEAIDAFVEENKIKMVRYIEELALPVVLLNYKEGKPESTNKGNASWSVDKSDGTITVNVNCSLFNTILITKNRVYDLNFQITQKVVGLYSKIPNVKVENRIYRDFFSSTCLLKFIFSIDGI